MQLKKIILIALMGLLIFSAKVTIADSNYYTKHPADQNSTGYCNGRWWSKMGETSKAMYLVGLQEGILNVTMRLEYDERSKLAYELVCGLNSGELRVLIDDFYSDKYNVKLPIIIAYSLIVYKANGATEEEFEERITGLRKIWK